MNKPDLISRIRRFYNLPEDHPEFLWTQTPAYQKRLEQVKNGWIIAGLLMLSIGTTSSVVLISAFTGFMSLAFLERDES